MKKTLPEVKPVRIKRSILMLCLCVCLLLQLAVPVSASDTTDIIRQLLTFYSHHQENARTDIFRLLEEMRRLDPEQAEDWKQIMDAWHLACTELTMNADILPEGLPEDDSLCIIVMGFALNANGSMRDELLGRLEAALASAERYPNAYILCTGGGTASGNYGVTEAGQMAAWLTEQGVAPERIIVENRSYSTELNAQYSIDILRESYPQVTSLALVSSDYHLRRCHWLFRSAIILTGLEDRCCVVSNAAYAAGYVGESGYFAEAESMGNLFGLYLRYTSAPALSQLTGISVTETAAHYPGESPDLTVTAEYDCGFTRDVTPCAELSGYDPAAPGSYEVTVSYTENGISASATCTVTVLEPPSESTAPTETEPATLPETTAAEPSLPQESGETAPRRDSTALLAVIGILLAAAAVVLAVSGKMKGKYQKRGR